MSNWYVYLVRCSDDSYYTGITTNVERRINQHNLGTGAKYTRSRTPVELEECKKFSNRSEASIEEARIKKLNRSDKESLIGEWRVERLRSEHVINMEEIDNEIEVIEAATEKSYSVLYQGAVLVNGDRVDYRWHEDSNGCEMYVLSPDGWVDADTVNTDSIRSLYDLILEVGPTEL